jgi:hypothetical protein
MSEPLLDLGNNANWVIVDSRTEIGVPQPGFRYNPIPGFTFNHLFESPIMAIKCVAPEARIKPTWWYAGRATMYARLGLGAQFGDATVAAIASAPAQLQAAKLFYWPKVVETYEVRFKIPYWISQMTVEAAEYVGPRSSEVLSALGTIAMGQARIETIVRDIQEDLATGGSGGP